MNEYLVKLPLIAVQARSEAEAYGLVMQWLQTTLSALPICDAVIIEPAEVSQAPEPKPDTSNVVNFRKVSKK